jgi:TATA-box binding protein (TBP) (component of TFIID and TFIIIB)
LQNVVGHFRVAPNPRVIGAQWQNMVLRCWTDEARKRQERVKDWKIFGYRGAPVILDSDTGMTESTLHLKGTGKKAQRERALERIPPSVKQQARRNFVVFNVTVGNANPSFTLFPKSGDVIVTGMKKESMLQECAERFCALTNTSLVDAEAELRTLITPTIDTWEYRKELTAVVKPWITNMTYSGVIGCQSIRRSKKQIAVMEAIARYSEMHRNDVSVSISMRSTFFPGAYLKHGDKRGVINVFRNGSYVIVGVRSKQEAKVLRDWLFVIMKEYWMTLKRGFPCACFAGTSSTPVLAAEEKALLAKFGSDETSGTSMEEQTGATEEEEEEEEEE